MQGKVNHLLERFKDEVKVKDSYYGDFICKWIEEGLKSSEPSVLAEMRAKHCEENFKDKFWEIAPQWINGSLSAEAKNMRETDGLSILELCFKLIP